MVSNITCPNDTRRTPAADLLCAGARWTLGVCAIGLRAPAEPCPRAPSCDDRWPFPRGCTPPSRGVGGEASPPRHSSLCSHSLSLLDKPIWLSCEVLIVTNPVTPTLGRKVRSDGPFAVFRPRRYPPTTRTTTQETPHSPPNPYRPCSSRPCGCGTCCHNPGHAVEGRRHRLHDLRSQARQPVCGYQGASRRSAWHESSRCQLRQG